MYGEGERENNTTAKSSQRLMYKEIWEKATWGILCPIFAASL